MTKTKRQLRAEAVERLSNYEEWHKKEKERHEDPDLLMAVIGGDSWGCTWQENRDALIDLLTDDEPTTAVNLYETSKRINSECESDGDAVSIMRNAQSKLLAPDYVRLAVGARDTSDMFAKLADMIERDYVRREHHCKVVDDNAKLFAKVLDERDGLASDLHAEHALVVQLQSDVERLQGERDEWKAKAERLDANGTADRTCPDAMGQASIVNADLPAENDVSSGHVDANDANSDSREKLEEDVRNGARYWAYDDSADAEANDECAKMLEDDVFSWLDRQAAITERDAFMRGRASLDDEFAELEADCTTAEREEDRLRGEVAGLEAKLQAQNRMVTQLLFERDAYRDKCGRMLDAIHEAERVMSE